MARVRYIGAEPVTVPELGRTVQPDELVEVPDDRFGGYVCQPATWEPVEEPRGWVWPGSEDESQDGPPAAAELPALAPSVEPDPKPAPKKLTAAKAAPTSKEG